MSRFRLGSHHLEIENGRYNNIQRSERNCKLCTQNLVESEYHFLLCCPLYRELRTKYFKIYHGFPYTKFHSFFLQITLNYS